MKFTAGMLLLLSSLCLSASAQNTSAADAEALPTAPTAASHIRIVRLSQVQGVVGIDRHVGRGYESAYANIPITAGTRLRTGQGVAEIEFEDNSTLRLTPNTEVLFPELDRSASGATLSRIQVVRGTVYASLAKTRGNIFTLASGNATLQLEPASHVRLTIADPDSTLAVLDGVAQFNGPSGPITVTHKKEIEFNTSTGTPPVLAKVQENLFDDWDKTQADYHKHYASLATSGGSGMLYGASDLSYYGAFVNLPGCGSVWRPYFASAAWDPYANGLWTWYPGTGYSWVSPYPWGWLPFHYGSWQSCGAAGWGWQPGGQWRGISNLPYPTRPTHHPCPEPPKPPRPGSPLTVAVNTRPLAVSRVTEPGTFTFRRDSAGLGIPRETLGNLRHLSSDVAHHGFATTEVHRVYIGPQPSEEGIRNDRAARMGDAAADRSTSHEQRPHDSSYSATVARGRDTHSSDSRGPEMRGNGAPNSSGGWHGANDSGGSRGGNQSGGWHGSPSNTGGGGWGGGGGRSAPAPAPAPPPSGGGGVPSSSGSSGGGSHK